MDSGETMSNQIDEQNDLNEILELEAPRRKWPRRILILLILLVGAGAGLWYFRPDEGGPATISFKTAEVTKGDLEVIVSATGTLEPVIQVDVGSEVSGTLRTVEADFNDSVAKGQVLARLDTTKLEAQRDQAQAALAVAKAELQQFLGGGLRGPGNHPGPPQVAPLPGQRRTATVAPGTGRSPGGLHQGRGPGGREPRLQHRTSPKPRSRCYETELDQSRHQIAHQRTGPGPGRLIPARPWPRHSTGAGALFTLAENLTNMSLYVSVDEADVGQVKEGQRATFVVDAYPDKKFPAKITQVRFAPQDNNGVVTYECILEVDNSGLLLRPGMTATADIITIEVREAILVPNSALRFSPSLPQDQSLDNGNNDRGFVSKIMPRPPRRQRRQKQDGQRPLNRSESKVWVLENDRPVPRPVALGPSDGINTQIVSSDIKPGAQVIIGQEVASR